MASELYSAADTSTEIDVQRDQSAAELDHEDTKASLVFLQAQRQFLDSIPEEEKSRYSTSSSAEDLLQDLRTILADAKSFEQKRTASALLKKIKTLSDSLEPYFRIVEIVIQSNPEFAAIAWGAFRLIVQFASNFAEFFEKLAIAIERIAAVFPGYWGIERYIDLRRVSKPFKSSLCAIYVDLFDFFRSLVRVFVKDNGKRKRTPIVIGSLVWKPFDVRFRQILERLDMHQEIVKEELFLSGFRSFTIAERDAAEERQNAVATRYKTQIHQHLTEQVLTDIEAELKKQTFSRLQAWLNPPNFMERLDEARRLQQDGTAVWLFEEATFVNWRGSDETTEQYSFPSEGSKVLWVKGNPGCGKTVLASSTVRELRNLPFAFSAIVCYYFFSQNVSEGNSIAGAYRAILAQILQRKRNDTKILDAFAFTTNQETGGQMIASRSEMTELLRVCLQSLGKAFIVLDAIDECDDEAGLLKDLTDIIEGSDVNIIFFSRPNSAHLPFLVAEDKCISMSGDLIEQDIELFLSNNIHDLVRRRLLMRSDGEAEIVKRLLQGSDGMFLWARLMINYLGSPALTPAQRLKAIHTVTLPERLEDMYQRTLGLITAATKPEQELAKRVFSWLAYGQSELGIQELHEALTSLPGKSPVSKKFVDIERSIILSCAGLVHTSSSKTCHFIHLSALEFFLSAHKSLLNRRYSDKFPQPPWLDLVPTKFEGHLEILAACLSYLTFQTPSQPLSGKLSNPASSIDLHKAFPLLKYSSTHWMHHLQSIIPTHEFTRIGRVDQGIPKDIVDDIFGVLSAFLPQKTTLMAMMEAFYVFGKGQPLNTKALRSWSDWALKYASRENLGDLRKLAEDVREFGWDLDNLHTLWGPSLAAAPQIIWEDITAYTPSRFFAQTNATVVTSLTPLFPKHEDLSTNPLSTISVVLASSRELGVLSIWPPRAYEDWAKNLEPKSHISDLGDICVGWIAKFEIWTTDQTPTLTTDLQIPLNENEIRLQICQSLSRYILPSLQGSADTEWKLQFPLEISKDLRIVIILRTAVFLDESATKTHTLKPKYTVTTVPTLPFGPTRERWTERACEVRNCSIKQTTGGYQSAYHGLYEYFFLLSPDNQFLFFADKDHDRQNLNVDKESKPFISTFGFAGIVAVYRLRPGPRGIRIVFVDSLPVIMSNIRSQNVAFHPKVPLVSFIAYDNIYMWAFGCGIKENHSSRDPRTADIRGIYFSECGTQLGVISHTLSVPIVIAVEPEKMFRLAQRFIDRFSLPSTSSSGSQAVSRSLQPGEIVVGRPPTAGVNFAVWLDQMNELCYEAYASKTTSWRSSAHSIKCIAIGDGYLSVQHVTSLPSWPDLDVAHATVIGSDPEEDRLKIVLNKVARHWSGMSDEKNSQLPLMVSKDHRALQQPTRRAIPIPATNHSTYEVAISNSS